MNTTASVTCLQCRQPLTFKRRRWVHPDGGQRTVRCHSCDWQGAPSRKPGRCPACGARRVLVDHSALPLWIEPCSTSAA